MSRRWAASSWRQGFGKLTLEIVLQVRFGKRHRRDPWRAGTVDWAMPTPLAVYGFASLPEVDRRADRIAPGPLGRDLAPGKGYLAFTWNGWQETLGVNVTSGRIDQLIVLPRATLLPPVTALALGVVVLAVLFKVFALAAAGFFVVMGLFVFAGQRAGLPRDFGPLDVDGASPRRPTPRSPSLRRGWRCSSRSPPTARFSCH